MVRMHAIRRFRQRVAPLPVDQVARMLQPFAARSAGGRECRIHCVHDGTPFVIVSRCGAVITVWRAGHA